MNGVLQAQLQQAVACRYVVAAGLAFLIYDHIISIADEVELIWKAKWTFPKVIFLLLRYAVPCALIVYNYQLAGLKSVQNPNIFCQLWFNIMICLSMTTIAIGNFLVLLRLWVIRNRNRIFICSTFVFFILSHMATLTCVIIVLIDVTPTMMYNRGLGMCIIPRRDILGSLFGPAVIFDATTLVATFWNALGRPRSSGMDFLSYLRNDGFNFVLLLFLMRVINFFVTLLGPLVIVFPTVCVLWATTTVTMSWLVLDIRRNGPLTKKNAQLDED